MSQRLLIVDCEATSATPYSGVMTEFGVVDFLTREWFHGYLWDSHPDPEVPARPIADRRIPGYTIESFDGPHPVHESLDVYLALTDWLGTVAESDRLVLVSDNPAFDFMWIADGFDRHDLPNPFGHTGRRIGDLAAGLTGKWQNTSAWKQLRVTTHDHNPVNDALGNAEALHTLLAAYGQIEERH